MRKGFAWVTIPPKALCKTEPSRQTVHNWPVCKIGFHTFGCVWKYWLTDLAYYNIDKGCIDVVKYRKVKVTYFQLLTSRHWLHKNKSNIGSLVRLRLMNSIDLQARNQRSRHGKMVQQLSAPMNGKWNECVNWRHPTTWLWINERWQLFTEIRSNQKRASCLNIFNGLKRNTPMIIVNASGLINGGILRLALYKKLKMLKVQTTPNIAANSIRCCSDKWFLGSSSKISTWFTPDERQP